ncbi:MAG: molybdopterin-guanine dinucleotide biosynthesis protein B [Promethearchaeota archaeon]
MPNIIQFVGLSKSGKTTAIEVVISFLKNSKYNVCTIKHIHTPPESDNFTIDTPGKNTWRMAKAGADPVVALSKAETAFIVKKSMTIESILKICEIINREQKLEEDAKKKNISLDYILIEGLWEIKSPKVLNIRTIEELQLCLKKIYRIPNPEEIINNIFCINFWNGDLKLAQIEILKKIKNLVNNKNLKIHESQLDYLKQIPMINVRENPSKLIELYETFILG